MEILHQTLNLHTTFTLSAEDQTAAFENFLKNFSYSPEYQTSSTTNLCYEIWMYEEKGVASADICRVKYKHRSRKMGLESERLFRA